jgi:multiple sugar transport system permease protein/lactose/L-arabinose transport system permease protein
MSSSNPVEGAIASVRERTADAVRPYWVRLIDAIRPFRQRQIEKTREIGERVPFSLRVPYIFLLPFFVLFMVFLAFSIVYTVYLSFHELVYTQPQKLLTIDVGPIYYELNNLVTLEFVGLDNYARLIDDDQFHNAAINTSFVFLIQVPLMIGLGLALALALNAAWMRFKGLFRTLIALPVSANLVAYATVFLIILQDNGLANFILTSMGLPQISWLNPTGDALPTRVALIGAVTWRWTGYNMIILLAGLQNVSQQLYEAAEIDGANRIQKFRHVTLPQLRPVLLFVLVTSTIGTSRIFSEPLILENGGAPREAVRTVVIYIYREAFINFNFGYASAISVVLVLFVALLSVVQLKVGGEDDE